MRVTRHALLAQIDAQATQIADLTDEVRMWRTAYWEVIDTLHRVTAYTQPGSTRALQQQAMRDQVSAAIVEAMR